MKILYQSHNFYKTLKGDHRNIGGINIGTKYGLDSLVTFGSYGGHKGHMAL